MRNLSKNMLICRSYRSSNNFYLLPILRPDAFRLAIFRMVLFTCYDVSWCRVLLLGQNALQLTFFVIVRVDGQVCRCTYLVLRGILLSITVVGSVSWHLHWDWLDRLIRQRELLEDLIFALVAPLSTNLTWQLSHQPVCLPILSIFLKVFLGRSVLAINIRWLLRL